MKRLFTARSIVQRDALMARLRRYGIESVTARRDVSRKLTETTLDLSLGIYSALANGFDVHVEDIHISEAERILAQFLKETEGSPQATRDDPWRRFYACAIFSLMMPGLMTAPATWHLVRGIRSGAPKNWVYLSFAMLCFSAGWVSCGLLLRSLIT